MDKRNQNLKSAYLVFLRVLLVNLFISVLKLAWGMSTQTLSITADGFHSLLDAVANLVGLVGLHFSMKPADHDHPYGHRKFEAMAALGIAFFIFLTCFELAGEGLHRLFSTEQHHPHITVWSYGVILLSLISNIGVTLYERHQAKKLQNSLLESDAQHTLSDAIVSAAVLISMAAVQMGFLWADTALALVVAVIILKVGYDLIMTHMSVLMDEAVLDPQDVSAKVLAVPGVLGCHKIRTRGLPDHVFIDLHIQVDPQLTIKEAHRISYAVESCLEASFDGRVSDVLVHVEEFEGETLPSGLLVH